ncbi:hypothetical protein Poli38472_009312 [Pythium oligandrum]|uniref:Uncharacterized protein n=1 Tax=Pythium oligandrum TaxID=41045 RepID=A0A8K1FIM2_PYTOL|nr:hypothetical protein Poli38472_009312 [Pythium oligandrum]|eukprot:TMW65145.1 hypothetical protein Poli38472_009312 [Pythium oligandrum]
MMLLSKSQYPHMSPKTAAHCDTNQSAMHYMTAPRLSATTPSERPCSIDMVRTDMETQNDRFVAGNEFFNYEQYGSLRPGLMPVELFSMEYIGLAVQCLLSGFVFNYCAYGYGAILAEYLRGYNSGYATAARCVLFWPQCFAIVIGLYSDCRPLWGHRRKSYMVIGWLVSFVFFGAIALVHFFTASSATSPEVQSSSYVTVFLVLSLVASAGIQVSLVAAIAFSVELAQREYLRARGRLQGTLIGLTCVGGLVAEVLISQNVSYHGMNMTSSISVSGAAGLIAATCAVAIPFCMFLMKEIPVSSSAGHATSIKKRTRELWQFCSQNLVYRVMFFIAGYTFLMKLNNLSARAVIITWSGAPWTATTSTIVARGVAKVLGVIWWVLLLKNTNWKLLAVLGTGIFVICNLALSIFTIFDVVRSEWFYNIFITIADVPLAWLLLYVYILPTEISNIGREGVVVGMCLSFQAMSELASFTVSTLIPHQIGFQVSPSDIKGDSSSTRMRVFAAIMIGTTFNLLALAMVPLLPNQKLDAQQLRAFGGYNRSARAVLSVVFVALVLFVIIANLIFFI